MTPEELLALTTCRSAVERVTPIMETHKEKLCKCEYHNQSCDVCRLLKALSDVSFFLSEEVLQNHLARFKEEADKME